MFTSIFTGSLTMTEILISLFAALLSGIILAAFHQYKNASSGSFLVTLSVLPAIVAIVIMLVDGNIGTGVAVAGTFSLVRFRSAQGNAREIASVFLAMAAGLAIGMGYPGLAIFFTILIGAVMLLLSQLPWIRGDASKRLLKITIPENLDYQDAFTDIFNDYTDGAALDKVRTVNMGSMYQLIYKVTLKDGIREKAMIDAIRTRNGNLEISLGHMPERTEQL